MQSTPSTTIAELAAQSMAAVRVFEKFGIDYCCGGKRPLEAVCKEQGIDCAAVTHEIETAEQSPVSAGSDWNTTPTTQLIQHIITTHHEFLRRELPLLAARIAKVLQAHGSKDARLSAVSNTFAGLKDELLHHLDKEETILFPLILRIETTGAATPPAVAAPISKMEAEHDSAGAALATLHELTDDFAIPAHACNTYRAMISGFNEIEADLHVHIHLENNILFPRVLRNAGLL